MAYKYIERTYGTTFRAGDRVRHSVTDAVGTVMRTSGDPQYYRVRKDGQRHGSNWHPDETRVENEPV